MSKIFVARAAALAREPKPLLEVPGQVTMESLSYAEDISRRRRNRDYGSIRTPTIDVQARCTEYLVWIHTRLLVPCDAADLKPVPNHSSASLSVLVQSLASLRSVSLKGLLEKVLVAYRVGPQEQIHEVLKSHGSFHVDMSRLVRRKYQASRRREITESTAGRWKVGGSLE